MIHPDGSPAAGLPELNTTTVDAARLGLVGPRLSWMEAGQGAPVLLLHGMARNSRSACFLMQGLAPQARVIAWNAPGYLLSDRLLAEAPSAEAYADAAVALLDALGETGLVHVVGSAFGAVVATALAARHPGRVATLALTGPSRGQRWKGAEARAMMLAMRAASIAEGGIAFAGARWQTLVAPGTEEVVGDLVRAALAATDAPGLMAAARCSDLVDVVVDFAPRVLAPSLVISGSRDAVNPLPVAQAVAAAIPFSRFVALEGVGHLPELEAPAQLLALLRAHMGLPAA